MDWSSALAELPKAVPTLVATLIGGVIAVAGGGAAQYLAHRFTRRREAEKLLREKAEELINALDQFSDWVTASIQASHPTPSPLNRATVLQVLYFPQLVPQFETMRQAAIQVFPLQARLTGQPADLK